MDFQPRFEEQPEMYLVIVAKMLEEDGMIDALNVLRKSSSKVEQVGYDNWNNGTTIWEVSLFLNSTDFAKLGLKRETIREQIDKRLEQVLKTYTDDWYNVAIKPKIEADPDWRSARSTNGDVSQQTRQNIIDGLKIDQVSWNGCLTDVEFLQRIYDLEVLPSHDRRFDNAAGDIWQHRENNPEDWPDDWIFDDERFNLLQGATDAFLRFLCEIVHPVVRPDRNESLKLVQHFNDQLRLEGWHLIEEEKIAGRPRFIACQVQTSSNRSISRARSVADALDAGSMQKEIERMEKSVESDPALTIGTAKEIVETCCKTILSKREIPYTRNSSLPDLTKLLAQELKLVPESVSDKAKGADTVRLILRNLSALTQYLAELRGLYGSGHGRDGKHQGLQPRHARLAVGVAATFIDFVTETHHQRETSSKLHDE